MVKFDWQLIPTETETGWSVHINVFEVRWPTEGEAQPRHSSPTYYVLPYQTYGQEVMKIWPNLVLLWITIVHIQENSLKCPSVTLIEEFQLISLLEPRLPTSDLPYLGVISSFPGSASGCGYPATCAGLSWTCPGCGYPATCAGLSWICLCLWLPC